MVPILEKENFKRSILQRLVYSVGKDTEHAVPRDWCVAVTLAVRDRLMDPWLANMRRIKESDVKRVYYLSMEFLIGRLLEDSMSNLGITEVCRQALADLNIDLDEILKEETGCSAGQRRARTSGSLFHGFYGDPGHRWFWLWPALRTRPFPAAASLTAGRLRKPKTGLSRAATPGKSNARKAATLFLLEALPMPMPVLRPGGSPARR